MIHREQINKTITNKLKPVLIVNIDKTTEIEALKFNSDCLTFLYSSMYSSAFRQLITLNCIIFFKSEAHFNLLSLSLFGL
jgi:hypothetical protein